MSTNNEEEKKQKELEKKYSKKDLEIRMAVLQDNSKKLHEIINNLTIKLNDKNKLIKNLNVKISMLRMPNKIIRLKFGGRK